MRRPPVELVITRSEIGTEVVLACAGRLDAETGDELARAVADELRGGVSAIRLDLSDTVFLSSAGIRGLFDTHRAAKAAGGSCLVRRASATVRRVLDLTRLTSILVEAEAGAPPAPPQAPSAPPPPDVVCGTVTLRDRVLATAGPLPALLHGSAETAFSGQTGSCDVLRLSRHAFGLGIGELADGDGMGHRAGEFLAACGTAFHRPPHPHAAVDYVVPAGDLRADVAMLTGLTWAGVPGGQAGFETTGDHDVVRLDDLAEAVLAEPHGDLVAFVAVGEIHGLVGAELIRPLAEARAGDTPRSGERDTVARWLSFSREPVFARHTALVVGVVAAGEPTGPLAGFVRRPAGRSWSMHAHAVVVPFRPIRRGDIDLATTVADVAASRPLAVLHLLTDPYPVLGSGISQFIRGAVWFAPLALGKGTTA
ncbi:MAG: STAS domain-containing protein [Planctomycetaceae bacterium]